MLRKALDKNLQLGFTLTEWKSWRYPAEKITNADYADDLTLLAGHIKDVMSLLHNTENVAQETGLYVSAGKIEFICLNQNTWTGVKSLNGENIKQADDFKYLDSYIASPENEWEKPGVRLMKWTKSGNQIYQTNWRETFSELQQSPSLYMAP